ncbi:formylglycine-generating enzyme family protein [Thiothrix winogradskyi]|uniref:Formylglycine-generating enzyme family protein n=1 Tax=Thiothrix winogradskyi TaxID=96472 RepID=A0ABY3SXF5_9GAMM|nr:formylglycine-generating enzyme family protein [Thiothrix winogradskyi]UJS24070.1 formylglycine-generating enzyme family protein [Thiothrix winogradskyi]
MSIESFLSNSVDSKVVNNYLRLLADKTVNLELHNEDLTKKLQLNKHSFSKIPHNSPSMQHKLLWSESVENDQYGEYAELVLRGVSSRFRWIKPGSFLMGSPISEFGREINEIQHDVTLTKGFWMADTACTQALWLAVMGSNSSKFPQNLQNPVDSVSWEDVQVFLQRANNSDLGGVLRLPFEAEWEYACRAGTDTPFAFGENITPGEVNYNGNYPYANGVKGLYRAETRSVKSLRANAWGLYQMHGNVWEWCQDWYGAYRSNPVSNPKGAESGTHRVLRGGSWYNFAKFVRSSSRSSGTANFRGSHIGFRLVLL